MVDVIKLAEDLIEAKDWRIRENANIPYSFSNVFFRLAGEALAEYVLRRIYPPEVAKAHVGGDIHIHNLYMGIVPYCMGWDLGLILQKGLSGIGGRLSTRPARRFRVALHHLVNFVGIIQNEAAGAQSFAGLDSLLAPYVANEKLKYEEVKQAMQEFVYGLNVTCRWGGQSPFTNVTFDWLIPEDLRDRGAFVGSQSLDATYEEFQEEAEMINRAFLKILLEEAKGGRVFTFPIPTYNITRDWDWEAENCDLLFEVAGKFGNPYFTNFINSDLKPSDIRSMCLHPQEELIILNNHEVRRVPIERLVEEFAGDFDDEGWARPRRQVKALSVNPKTLKVEWSSVKRFLRVESNELVEITTEDGKSIRVTPNHPVPVLTPSGMLLKLAKDVRLGDFMLCLKSARKALGGEYQKISAGLGREGGKKFPDDAVKKLHELGLSDEQFARVFRVHPRTERRKLLRSPEKREEDVKKVVGGEGTITLNERVAWLLGLFTADGNYLFEGGRPRGLQFTFSADEIELKGRVKRLIEELFGCTPCERKDLRYNATHLYVYRSRIAKALFEAGFRKYGRVPDVLFKSPPSVIEAFLEGFLEGDSGKGYGVGMSDEELARDLMILNALVGKPTCYKAKDGHQRICYQRKRTELKANGATNSTLYELVPGWMVKSTYSVPGLGKRMVSLKTLAQRSASKLISRSDVAVVCVKAVMRRKLPALQTFYDIELEENHLFVHSLGTVTHNCCHLRLDLTELKRNITGGLFSSAVSTGSIGVVTINMPRIGFLSKDDDEFFERLERIMLLAKESLEVKRKALNEFLEKGLLPYVKEYLGTFENHFSTIGLVGMNEACLNFLGESIATEAGKEFTIRALRFMLERLQEFQQETKNLYNLEATPAESCCYRLAKLDKQKFPQIITAGRKFPYYTNSTWLPVDYTDNLLWAIRHQEELQTLYTGGTVFHIFLNEAASAEACKRIVRRTFENTRLPYLTLTPTFSVCPEHGHLKGKREQCPICGKKAEIYSRVVGYYRPVDLWNEGKKEEFGSRLGYRLSP